MNLSVRLFRSSLTGACLWLMVVTGAAPAVAAGVSCDDWNTQKFFKRADGADVARCVKAGEDPKSRSVFSGDAPLHYAAAYATNPAVIAALGESGGGPQRAESLQENDAPVRGRGVRQDACDHRGRW